MQIRSLAMLVTPILVLSGCVDDQATVQFGGMCFPATPTAEGCAYSAKCDSVWMTGRIWADVGYAPLTEVTWPIQISNVLKDNTNTSTGQTNTNDAVIDGVKLTYSTSGLSIPSATFDQTAVVVAGGTTVIEVELMPPAIVTFLSANLTTDQEVMVKVRLFGHYKNGHSFEVGPFQVPIDVCNGCYSGPGTCSTAGEVPVFCPGPFWHGGQSAVAACITL